MRFLLDENIHRGLLSFLIGLGHDVKSSPKGLSNGKVLALAASEERILITHDEDFADHPVPGKHTGIILVKIPSHRLEQLKRSTEQLLVKRGSAEQTAGRLIVLFEDRIEEFPHTTEGFLL